MTQLLVDGRQPISQTRAKVLDVGALGGGRHVELHLPGSLHLGLRRLCAGRRRWTSPEGHEQDERVHAPVV